MLWAAILLVAALSKLAGMPASMLRAMRDLGLPSWLMRPLYAYLHLTAQLTIAAGLVLAPRPYSWIFTIGAVVLAAIYLAIVLARQGFQCRCFGDKPSTMTGATAVRNIAILVLAVASLGADGIWGLSGSDWPALIPFTGAVLGEAAMRRRNRA